MIKNIEPTEKLDVFISYKREERSLMHLVSEKLKSLGYVVASDEQIERNDYFPDAIDQMIHDARITIVLWTKLSVDSPWVKKEAQRAVELEQEDDTKNAFLGIIVEPLKLPMYFIDENQFDISDVSFETTGLQKIAAEIANVIGTPSLSERKDARQNSDKISAEYQLYSMAHQLNTVESYQGYLATFPSGRFATSANEHINDLKRVVRNRIRKLTSLGALGVIVAALAALPAYVSLMSEPPAQDPVDLTSILEQINENQKLLQQEQTVSSNLRSEIAQTEEKIQQANARQLELDTQISQQQSAYKRLEDQYNASVLQLNDYVASDQNSAQQIDQLTEEKDVLFAQKQELQTALDALLNSQNNLVQDTQIFQKQAEDLRKQVAAELAENEKIRNENKDLINSIENLTAAQKAQAALTTDKDQMYHTVLLASLGGETFQSWTKELNEGELLKLNSLPNEVSATNINLNYLDPVNCTNFNSVRNSYEAVTELIGLRFWLTQKAMGYPSNDYDPAGAVYETSDFPTLSFGLHRLELNEINNLVRLGWRTMTTSTKTHYSLHHDIMGNAKDIVDELIAGGKFQSISELAVNRVPDLVTYTYCNAGRKNVIHTTVFNSGLTMGGHIGDIAQYPVAFWARRYVDGTYPQADQFFNEIDDLYSSFCASNSCRVASPYVKSRLN